MLCFALVGNSQVFKECQLHIEIIGVRVVVLHLRDTAVEPLVVAHVVIDRIDTLCDLWWNLCCSWSICSVLFHKDTFFQARTTFFQVRDKMEMSIYNGKPICEHCNHLKSTLAFTTVVVTVWIAIYGGWNILGWICNGICILRTHFILKSTVSRTPCSRLYF